MQYYDIKILNALEIIYIFKEYKFIKTLRIIKKKRKTLHFSSVSCFKTSPTI